jgi:dephospho-CoA kinase
MIKAAITGGIGSGKTIACRVFESLGVPVYYADMEARRLIDSNPDIQSRLTELFGSDVYSGKTLNRSLFASIVFTNPKLLEASNAIIHPYVRDDFYRWTLEYNNHRYVVEETAILFESGGNAWVDKSIIVVSPIDIRIKRLLKRTGMTQERINEVMSNQWADDKKVLLSDYVITNDERSLMLPQILSIHKQLTAI